MPGVSQSLDICLKILLPGVLLAGLFLLPWGCTWGLVWWCLIQFFVVCAQSISILFLQFRLLLVVVLSLSTERCCWSFSGQWLFRILLKQLLMKVCTLLIVDFVILHVLTDFIIMLKTLIFVCCRISLEHQMFLSCSKAVLSLPILLWHPHLYLPVCQWNSPSR